jgi:hypothetical protein
MLTIESVKELKMGSEDGSTIVAMVKFKEFDEALPYGINAWDPEPHGIELYNQVFVQKMHGTPAAWVSIPEPEPLTAEQKLERTGLTADELKTLLGL